MRLIIKKNNKYHIIYILLFTEIFFCCCNDDNLISNENEKNMKFEIIPFEDVSIKWDSTIYQHSNNWNSYLDTNAYDSLAFFFKNSDLLIEDMWCPNEDIHCKIPYIPGMEVIIKLSKADSSIYKYEFQDYTHAFPIDCFSVWRHYKFIDD